MSMSAVTPLIIGIIQNLQTSPIPQTSFLPWTFFATSYSKIALVCKGHSVRAYLDTI